jgi:exonuclease VII small subunit
MANDKESLEKNLGKLSKILTAFDEKVITYDEFIKAFENVVKLIKKVEAKHLEAIELLKQTFTKLQVKLEDDNLKTTNILKGKVDNVFVGEQIDKMVQANDERTMLLDSKIKEFTNLINKRLNEVKDGYTPIKGKDYFDGLPGRDGQLITSEDVRDKLERLKEDERLDLGAIKGLKTILREFRRSLSGRAKGTPFGGSVVHKFMDDETPSGTVNGSNTTFTTAKSPLGLKVYVNGQKMTVTEDYTLSNKTITFNTAPPTNSVVRVDYRYY